MLWLLLILPVLAFLTYRKLSEKNKYWIEKGVKQGDPWPIFGDKIRVLLHNESLADMVLRIYSVGPGDRYCGAYDFMSPALVIKDPEIIKDIMVKDFEHFVDHKRVIPEDSDPIWDKNLFFLTAQKWKDMRSALSPAFTGSKMRHMFSVITKCARQFVGHFTKQQNDVIEIEMKDTFARFTNDIIAIAVFAFESDSLEERDSKFFEMAKRITDFKGFWQGVRMFGYFIVPKLYKALHIRILSTEVANFFYNIVKENIISRKKQNMVRPDMINLLMEARENQKMIQGIEITDADITAQALVFFFAGFDSVSSMMCFTSYELALNPDVQRRLFEEINQTRESCGEDVTYEVIQGMKYLDMVVSESLRKWPITPFVNRVCTKPFTIDAKEPGENAIHFKLGDIVFLPIYGLHRDPKFFPEPDRFDPERFSDANKININPYIYMPFGSGPRKCIGYRFALLEVKILFYYLLSQFEITITQKTQIPVQIDKDTINITPEGGLWIALKKRHT